MGGEDARISRAELIWTRPWPQGKTRQLALGMQLTRMEGIVVGAQQNKHCPPAGDMTHMLLGIIDFQNLQDARALGRTVSCSHCAGIHSFGGSLYITMLKSVI